MVLFFTKNPLGLKEQLLEKFVSTRGSQVIRKFLPILLILVRLCFLQQRISAITEYIQMKLIPVIFKLPVWFVKTLVMLTHVLLLAALYLIILQKRDS